MAGLVEQLQAESLDLNVPVSSLLRKVKLAAVKLQLPEAVEWVDAELNGYKDEVPEYRRISGVLKAFSPYQGWQAVGGSGRVIDALSNRQVGSSIAELEALLTDKEDHSDSLLMYVSGHIREGLLKDQYGWTEVATVVSRTSVVGIVEHVRNTVFNWALDLEKAGIMGDGLSFSSTERAAAANSQIHIQHFTGNLHQGELSGANARVDLGSVDTSTSIAVETTIFADVRTAIEQNLADLEARDQLLKLVKQMQESQGKSGYLAAYQKFVAAAANHMTIIAPFLPVLSGFISG